MNKDFDIRLIGEHNSQHPQHDPAEDGWTGEGHSLEYSLENYDYVYKRHDLGGYSVIVNAFGLVASIMPEKTRKPDFPVVFVADIFLPDKPLSNSVSILDAELDCVLKASGNTLEEFDALPVHEQLKHLAEQVALWRAFDLQIEHVRTVPVLLYTVTADTGTMSSIEFQTPKLEAAFDQFRQGRVSGWKNIILWRNHEIELRGN